MATLPVEGSERFPQLLASNRPHRVLGNRRNSSWLICRGSFSIGVFEMIDSAKPSRFAALNHLVMYVADLLAHPDADFRY